MSVRPSPSYTVQVPYKALFFLLSAIPRYKPFTACFALAMKVILPGIETRLKRVISGGIKGLYVSPLLLSRRLPTCPPGFLILGHRVMPCTVCRHCALWFVVGLSLVCRWFVTGLSLPQSSPSIFNDLSFYFMCFSVSFLCPLFAFICAVCVLLVCC